MKKKRIMIVGAGPFQLPAIRKAREMGFRVVATDRDPNACGFKEADDAELVDVKDIKESIKIAQKYEIDGVMSIVSELGVKTVSAVAQALGLKGLSLPAAEAATNKTRMREIFRKAGLPIPSFKEASTLSEARAAVKELGLPLVLKPVDNSGSRGVTKVSKASEVEGSFNFAKKNSLCGKVILENYLEGTEMTIEALSYRGRHQVLAMSSKKRIDFPYCVSIDLTYPPLFSHKIQEQVKNLIASALTAMGIDIGATHSEVMVTDRGVYIVEVAARGGGYGVFSDIIYLTSGVDAVSQCINMVMGHKVNILPKYSRAAVLRFFTPPLGRVKNISGLEEALKLRGVNKIELGIKPGDMVRPITRDGERPGLMITCASTRKKAVAVADQIEKLVHFEIEGAE